MDLIGHVPPEGVEAEPPHAWVDRLRPAQHDATRCRCCRGRPCAAAGPVMPFSSSSANPTAR